MFRIRSYFFFLVILLVAVLASACDSLITPVRTSGEAPTPVVRFEGGATDDPNVFVDHAPFQAALLQAIQSRDEAKLKRFMAENFVSGWWRGEMGALPQADALRELYQDQLGDEIKLAAAPGVDLAALLGGTNPLDIPDPEANVVNAVLVRGWGKDGKDEAILFISRRTDNSLRWAGTMVIKGGFSSPETGGVQPLINSQHGYQAYLPLGYEVDQSQPGETVILAPKGTEGHRERAFISVEPANGRTAQQMVDEIKVGQPPQFANQTALVLGMDTEMALVLDKIPSQEIMRVLYVVHEDRLYRMIFIPNDPSQGAAYNQMRSLYAVFINTFKFIPVEGAGAGKPSGGKLVAEPDVFINLLQQGLSEHNKTALQLMMGESFILAYWQSEGIQITPGEAIQQILNNYAPAGSQPVLDPKHALIAKLFPEHPKTETGEELIPVYVSGWGAEGQDEGILFIARRADGSLYWQGALTALGGFRE